MVFDTKAEMGRWGELKLRETLGEISGLRRQVRYPLVLPTGEKVKIRSAGAPAGRQCYYTADFVYVEDGAEVVEEYKGRDDPASRLRRAVYEACYGVAIRTTGPASYRGRKPARKPVVPRPGL